MEKIILKEIQINQGGLDKSIIKGAQINQLQRGLDILIIEDL